MEAIATAILHKIQHLPQTDALSVPLIVAIDGRCAAGKTTLSAILEKKCDCNVFHMDDFFLRPQQRTEERLSQPGGNVDYERFRQEALIPISQSQEFSYRPYRCHIQQLIAPVSVSPKAINIVEGSYSCHPALEDFYSLRIFLTVDKEQQLARIRKRNGPEQAKIFESRWIPLEERYFSDLKIQQHCQLCFDTSHPETKE